MNERPPPMPIHARRRVLTFTIVIALFAGLSALLTLQAVAHSEPILLAAEYFALLPSTILLVRMGDGPPWKFSIPDVRLTAAVFLVVALSLSWYVSRGLLFADESAYRFQSEIFARGRWSADAPPGATAEIQTTPKPLYYEHHILQAPHWFTKYPPGWPLILALGTGLRAGWAVNPLLAFALLFLTWRIGQVLFGNETGRLAALLMALSPFFLVNSIGVMAHMACSVLIAAACLECFRGIRLGQSRPLAAIGRMFVLLGCAFFVRPLTAAVLAIVMSAWTIWHWRPNQRLVGRAISAGCLAGMAAASGMLGYQKLYTGAYWLSPYALSANLAIPPEINLKPQHMVQTLFGQGTRWSIQSTLLYTVPFMFVVAAYAVWREKEHKAETWMLALLLPSLALAYLVQTDTSGSVQGERYYFEAFFAVAILAARGLMLLFKQWEVSGRAAFALLCGVCGLQVCQQALSMRAVASRSAPYRAVRLASEQAPAESIVFLRPALSFVPKHFNLNHADWKRQTGFFLVDPGTADERARWARLYGRRRWVTLSYDRETRTVTEEPGEAQPGK